MSKVDNQNKVLPHILLQVPSFIYTLSAHPKKEKSVITYPHVT